MRFVAVLVFMVMAGCASNGVSVPLGNHAKSNEPVHVERMGSMTTLASLRQPMCHTEQVLLCRGEVEDGDCRCVTIHDAERSLQRVTYDRQRRHIRQGFRSNGPH